MWDGARRSLLCVDGEGSEVSIPIEYTNFSDNPIKSSLENDNYFAYDDIVELQKIVSSIK